RSDIRYTLQTDSGDSLYVQSHGVRHGSADALTRLARGEDVDASEEIFRTSTQIETAAPALDWLSKGVLISVGGRPPGAVICETHLVALRWQSPRPPRTAAAAHIGQMVAQSDGHSVNVPPPGGANDHSSSKNAGHALKEKRADVRARRDHRAGARHAGRHEPRHRPRPARA